MRHGVGLYSVAGLRVESEVVLPGLISVPDLAMQEADVSIATGAVPDALEDASQSGPTWQSTDNRFLLRIPNIARFLLSDGRRIVVETEQGTPQQEVAIFLLGTVFGILLHQRAQIVLHASSVRVGDKAVIFCGPSGAGKSTLAAALVQRGYPLVSDDLCALALEEGRTPHVQPDGRQLKLWSQAIKVLKLGDARGAPVRSCLEKFYVEPACNFASSLPLAAVYVLREARPPHDAGITRPNVVDAALLLRSNAYRPRLVEKMGQRPRYFHAATTIASQAGIYHLTRRLNFADMGDVVSRLERHWEENGLVERVV